MPTVAELFRQFAANQEPQEEPLPWDNPANNDFVIRRAPDYALNEALAKYETRLAHPRAFGDTAPELDRELLDPIRREMGQTLPVPEYNYHDVGGTLVRTTKGGEVTPVYAPPHVQTKAQTEAANLANPKLANAWSSLLRADATWKQRGEPSSLPLINEFIRQTPEILQTQPYAGQLRKMIETESKADADYRKEQKKQAEKLEVGGSQSELMKKFRQMAGVGKTAGDFGLTPPAGLTNAMQSALSGAFPESSGIPLPNTNAPSFDLPNPVSAPRVRRYNPATGRIE